MTSDLNTPIATQSSPQTVSSLPPEVDAVLAYAAQRRLLLPLLLFVAAHRPLGFALGQLLLAAQPLTLLSPSLRLRGWAETLSDLDGVRQLETRLLIRKREIGRLGDSAKERQL